MSWETILRALASEGAVIAAAPLSFAAALLVASGLVFLIARWMYSTVIAHKDARISSLEERVKLRDDQLSDKFQSTPPDEAKALIAALQEQVAKLQPRGLTDAQKKAIASRVGPPDGSEWRLRVRWNGLAFDAEAYAEEFMAILEQTGWKVHGIREIGGGGERGVILHVGDDKHLSSVELVLSEALTNAGIAFKVVQQEAAKAQPLLYIGYPDKR